MSKEGRQITTGSLAPWRRLNSTNSAKRSTKDPIGDLFGRVEKQATAQLHKAPKDAKLPNGPGGKEQVDPRWVKDSFNMFQHVSNKLPQKC